MANESLFDFLKYGFQRAREELPERAAGVMSRAKGMPIPPVFKGPADTVFDFGMGLMQGLTDDEDIESRIAISGMRGDSMAGDMGQAMGSKALETARPPEEGQGTWDYVADLLGDSLPGHAATGLLRTAATGVRAGAGALSYVPGAIGDKAEFVGLTMEELMGNLTDNKGFFERFEEDPVGALIEEPTMALAQMGMIWSNPFLLGGMMSFGNASADQAGGDMNELQRFASSALVAAAVGALERSGIKVAKEVRNPANAFQAWANSTIVGVNEGFTEFLQGLPEGVVPAMFSEQITIADGWRSWLEGGWENFTVGAMGGGLAGYHQGQAAHSEPEYILDRDRTEKARPKPPPAESALTFLKRQFTPGWQYLPLGEDRRGMLNATRRRLHDNRGGQVAASIRAGDVYREVEKAAGGNPFLAPTYLELFGKMVETRNPEAREAIAEQLTPRLAGLAVQVREDLDTMTLQGATVMRTEQVRQAAEKRGFGVKVNESGELRLYSKRDGQDDRDVGSVDSVIRYARKQAGVELTPVERSVADAMDQAEYQAITEFAEKYNLEKDEVKTLPDILESNVGRHLRRSYEAHVNPDEWVASVLHPEGSRRELFDNFVDFNMRTPTSLGGMKEIYEKKVAEFGEEKAKNYIGQLASEFVKGSGDPVFAAIEENDPEGFRTLSGFLHRRRALPEEHRALLGEISDPVRRYIDQMNNWHNFLATKNAMEAVIEMGHGKWLFDRPEDVPHTEATPVQVGTLTNAFGDQEARMMYAHPDVAHAIDLDVTSLAAPIVPGFDKYFDRPVKGAVTSLNPGTHIRNWSFWTLQALALGSGRANTIRSLPLLFSKPGEVTEHSARMGGYQSLEDFRDWLVDAARFGVVGESTRYHDMREHGKSPLDHPEGAHPDKNLTKYGSEGSDAPGVVGKLIKLKDFAEATYLREDDLPRLAIWKDQARLYARDKGYKLGENAEIDAEAKQWAADRLRRYTPTWSEAFPLADTLREIPFVFPFPTFALEMARTAPTLLVNSMNDLVRQDATPFERTMASRALTGTVFAAYGGKAVFEGMARALGFLASEEEKEALQYLTERDFEEGENWTVWKVGDTWVTMDYGQLSPWDSILMMPLRELTDFVTETEGRGSVDEILGLLGIGAKVAGNFGAQATPATDIALNSMDIMRSGHSPDEKADRLRQEATRGLPIYGTIDRAAKSVSGERTYYGTEYNPAIELANVASPMRMYDREPAIGFNNILKRINSDYFDIKSEFTTPLRDLGDKRKFTEIADDQMGEADRLNELFMERDYPRYLKAYRAAKTVGMKPVQIHGIMSKAGVPKFVRDLLVADYEPDQVPDSMKPFNLKAVYDQAKERVKYRIYFGVED